MYPTRDIIDNAVNSADHTTLVAAVKAAGLVDTLKGSGPLQSLPQPMLDFYTGKPAYNVNTGGLFQHNVVFSGGLVLRSVSDEKRRTVSVRI